MDRPRVLLVDDEQLLLESLEIILTLGGMEIAGTARDGKETLSLLRQTWCDVALVDINMQGMGGIELIGHLKKEYPGVKILVLTTFYDDETITNAISKGADGYLLKDSGKDAILGAVGQIMNGFNVIDAKVMKRLAALMSGPKSDPDILRDMTAREKEIATLRSPGLSNKQIARQLYISEGTVKNYISVIYDKTGIHDRAKLIVAIKS